MDDNADVRRLFATYLKSAGFEVYEASDGTHALRIIEESGPEVCVLDIGLPTLDGVSVREEIAERHPGVRVVIVTGLNVEGTLFRDDRVLRKPVTPEQLIAAVEECMSRRIS